MPDIFISYSRHNMDAANAFAELLRGAGLDVFIDYERMQGDNFPARIAHEIENSRFVLFLVSQHSTESKWVKREVQFADKKNVTTLVLRLDNTELPNELFFLEYTDYIDATRWIATAPIPATVSEKLGRALNVTFKAAPARVVAPPPSTPTYTPPASEIFIVAKTGPANFRTITEAIQKVPEGATIKVRPGLYRESLKLTKAVELIGDGNRDDILIESANNHTLWMDTDNAIVRGLTLCQAGTAEVDNCAVYIPKGRLILEDCTLSSASISTVVLDIANLGTNPVIRHCKIHDGSNGGVLVRDNSTGTFEDCKMIDNGLSGIEVKTGANPVVHRCRMERNEQSGLLISKNATGTFENCHILNNGFSDKNYPGVEIRVGSNPTLRGCTISGNKSSGIYAHINARGTVENCDLRGNGKGAFVIDATSQLVRRNNREG